MGRDEPYLVVFLSLTFTDLADVCQNNVTAAMACLK